MTGTSWTKVTGGAQGVGLGFRLEHAQRILEEEAVSPWFEVLADNFFVESGPRLAILDKLTERYPLAVHCVGLNLGGTDPLDREYLAQLKKLINRINPLWVSDHLCWTSFEGRRLNELMPLPFTQETIKHVAERIKRIQDALGRHILVENLSSYVSFEQNEMPEWEFLSQVAQEADCMILLDVNNIYVSARNAGFSSSEYVEGVTPDRVAQFHLAGFEEFDTHYLDTHGREVPDEVLELFEKTIERFGPRPTLIEWDSNLPPFETLKAQAVRAEQAMSRAMSRKSIPSAAE